MRGFYDQLRTHEQRGCHRSGGSDSWSLDAAQIDLTGDGDYHRLRDLYEGVFAVGGPGSGKSSTTIVLFFETLLRIGAGALLLTEKVGDAVAYLAHCARLDRLRDVIRVRPGGPHKINLIDYAYHMVGRASAGGTEMVVSLLRVATAVVDGDGGRQEVGEKIWDRARDNLLRNLVDLLIFAGEPLTLRNLARALATAPSTPAEVTELLRVAGEVRAGRRSLDSLPYFARCWFRAGRRDVEGTPAGLDRHTREATLRYWKSEWPNLPDRTQGSVRFSFNEMASVLLRGDIADLCTTETTFSLRDCLDGTIILLDLAPKTYGQAGRMLQALFKHLWQIEMERREVPPQGGVRPQLLLCDEAQGSLCEDDIRFAATARSAGVCTVMATQSIASVRRALGADGAENLLGVLQTKITHACDGETAQWMSDLIGHDRTYRATVGADGSMSFAETVEPLVPPIAFSRLARGGKRFGFESGAYVFKPGAKWGPDGRNYLEVRLAQRRGR